MRTVIRPNISSYGGFNPMVVTTNDPSCTSKFIPHWKSLVYFMFSCPIGSMYAIYGNIYHQYTPNVSIYTIHGSYGCYVLLAHVCTWFLWLLKKGTKSRGFEFKGSTFNGHLRIWDTKFSDRPKYPGISTNYRR